MEYFFIAGFIIAGAFILYKFPHLKQKLSLLQPLFCIFLLFNIVFVHFTIGKLIALLILMGSFLYPYIKYFLNRDSDNENKSL